MNNNIPFLLTSRYNRVMNILLQLGYKAAGDIVIHDIPKSKDAGYSYQLFVKDNKSIWLGYVFIKTDKDMLDYRGQPNEAIIKFISKNN